MNNDYAFSKPLASDDLTRLTDEAVAWLESYRAAFQDLDARRISSFYQVPNLSMSAAAQIVYNTEEELFKNFELVVEQFGRLGFAKCAFEITATRFYGADLAEWVVHWSAFAADGRILKVLRNTYVMRRVAGNLRIIGVILTDS